MSKKNRQARAAAQAAAPSQPAAAASTDPQEVLLDFDGWWAMRATKIPPQHHKEVIKADFRGRGLSTMETVEDYDDALKEYGLKLS